MANRNNNWQRNLGNLIGGILSLTVAWNTATGNILNWINFADPLNEMAFCLAATVLGTLLIYVGIPQRHWRKLNPLKTK
tara:strand:+ start:448 stop:684 length:237 start_codon:yes stop_codon:yes gene_type:complete